MAQLAAHYFRVDGVRKPATPLLPGNTLAIFLPLTGVLCVVLLAILARISRRSIVKRSSTA